MGGGGGTLPKYSYITKLRRMRGGWGEGGGTKPEYTKLDREMGRNSFRHTVFDSKTTVHVLLTLFLPYFQRHHDSYSGLGLMYLEGMGLEQVRMQHSVVHTFTR